MRIIAIATLLVLALAAITPCTADTRGLRVVARDPATDQTGEVKLYNKSYAVIIGIDRYQNLPPDRQLRNAVKDALGVAAVLNKQYQFDRIITLQDEEATKERIMRLLTLELPKEMGKDDALFLFWAGHGNQEKSDYGDLGYLIPYDGSTEEIYRNITMAEIRDTISKRLPAKHVFYVMDACYSGLLTSRSVDSKTRRDLAYLKAITKESVRQVLTAGGKGEEALDGGPKGHSVFTGRLIEILESADDFITANELQASIKERVYSDARARNHTQTPGFGPLYGLGDFVFIPKQTDRLGNLAGESALRQQELEQLKKVEAEAKAAKKREQQEIARKQAELDTLDKQIADMKARLGSGVAQSGDSMDQLLALAEQKEQQGQHLEQLRQQREAEELKRQQEIRRLERVAEEKLLGQIEANLAKYKKIATSKYAQDMKPAAWSTLVATYPEAKNVPQYDENAFREAVGLESRRISGSGSEMSVNRSLSEEQKTLHAVGLIIAQQLSVFRLTFAELRIITKGITDGSSGKNTIVDMEAYKERMQTLARLRQNSAGKPMAGTEKVLYGNPAIETDEQKTLYAVGLAVAQQIRVFDFTSEELGTVIEGVKDGMTGKMSVADEDALKKRVQEFAAARNNAKGSRLAAGANEVVAKVINEGGAVKTSSGLVFVSLKEGYGTHPTESDKVKVHYRGILTDGKEFDSSYKRGQPSEFPLNGVIKCWVEGVQMMKVGGKAKLVCPPELAYGDRGAGSAVPPKATLIFEVELLDVKK